MRDHGEAPWEAIPREFEEPPNRGEPANATTTFSNAPLDSSPRRSRLGTRDVPDAPGTRRASGRVTGGSEPPTDSPEPSPLVRPRRGEVRFGLKSRATGRRFRGDDVGRPILLPDKTHPR